MAQPVFLSVVTVLEQPRDAARLGQFLQNIYQATAEQFSDVEFVVVNNLPGQSLKEEVEPLPMAVKKLVYMVNLSTKVDYHNAITAGLDRANGDYVLLYEMDFYNRPELVEDLYQKAQENYDVVYLRGPKRQEGALTAVLTNLFFWVMRHFGKMRIDPRAHNSRLISRRALNAVLRLREAYRYTKAIFSFVGYRMTKVDTDLPVHRYYNSFADNFRASASAITSYTYFMRALMLWIFIFSLLFFLGITTNALLVKYLNQDIFGHPQQEVPGWTFLVIFTSVMFMIVLLNMYLMSIYLSNIYQEIKQRPIYIVESIQRF